MLADLNDWQTLNKALITTRIYPLNISSCPRWIPLGQVSEVHMTTEYLQYLLAGYLHYCRQEYPRHPPPPRLLVSVQHCLSEHMLALGQMMHLSGRH